MSATTDTVLEHLPYILTLRYDPFKYSSSLPQINQSDCRPSTTTKDEVMRLLQASMKKQLGNTKHVVVAFSAGNDSSLTCLLAKQAGIKVTAVLLYDNDFAMFDIGEEFCRKFDINFMPVKLQNPIHNLLDDIRLTCEPKWNRYLYTLFGACTNYGDTVAFGDGGDEIFGGYDFRYNKFMRFYHKYTDNDVSRSVMDLYLMTHARDWVPATHEMLGKKLRYDTELIYTYFKQFFIQYKDLHVLERVFLADYHGKLMREWQPTTQKFLLHFKMKGVFPFLDRDVIRACFRLPLALKYENGRSRITQHAILKELGYDVSSTHQIKGAWLPMSKIWNDGAKDLCMQYLDNPVVCQEGWINSEWVRDLLTYLYDHNEPRYVNKAIQLLALEIWYRLFIKQETIKSL